VFNFFTRRSRDNPVGDSCAMGALNTAGHNVNSHINNQINQSHVGHHFNRQHSNISSFNRSRQNDTTVRLNGNTVTTNVTNNCSLAPPPVASVKPVTIVTVKVHEDTPTNDITYEHEIKIPAPVVEPEPVESEELEETDIKPGTQIFL
jgi:hypothetical protein